MPFSAVTANVRTDILELARFLTELSVIDYFFVTQRPSHVAIAALMNGLDGIPEDPLIASQFSDEIEKVFSINTTCVEIVECRNRLRLLYAQGGYSRHSVSSAETRGDTISPVCVSYGCTVEMQPSRSNRGDDDLSREK